jgi:succinyl-CoA synthetase beta subunit
MKLHEYQAKEILARHGVPVPAGKVASTPEEAIALARSLGGDVWVIKAQIHAGGRGKGGGVKVCRGIEALEREARRIIGMDLVTPQTGPGGQRVRKVLVGEACEVRREFYAGIVLDRRISLPVLMASAEGGVEIEEVASRSPEKILKEVLSPVVGLRPYAARSLARRLGLGGELLGPAASLLVSLARAYLESDASIAEINPLALCDDGRLLALDAKLVLDDNALFRHPDLAALRDVDEEDPLEVRASRSDLSYIRLDGDIGCMVNGAGLAMATLDILKHEGGSPANFLDVGGGATADKVAEAMRIILEDGRVRAVLVNIFGGIMRCDVIAQGIVEAVRRIERPAYPSSGGEGRYPVPLVVRLEGTNVREGKEILAASGLPIISADGLLDAARRSVAAARGGGAAGGNRGHRRDRS